MKIASLGSTRTFDEVSKGAIFLAPVQDESRYCLKVSWTVQHIPSDYFLVLTPPLPDQGGVPFIIAESVIGGRGLFEISEATIQPEFDSVTFGNDAVKAGNVVASGDDLFLAFLVHGGFGDCAFANLKTGDVLDNRPPGPLVGFRRWSVVQPKATDTITLQSYPAAP